MRKLIALAVLAFGLTLTASAQQPAKYGTIVKTVADPDVPEAVVSTNLYCQKITFYGKKAVRTANTGTIYIGESSSNGAQPVELTTGDEYSFSAAPNKVLNLKDFYIDVVSAGDGVVVRYQ